MGTIECFEDLVSWQKARLLTKVIYQASDTGRFASDFGLRDQIRRASVSIMSNIAEGFERGGNKEFRQFLSHAKGSAGEVRSQLYVALDAEFISTDHFNSLKTQVLDISKLIAGLMHYLDTTIYKGSKYH